MNMAEQRVREVTEDVAQPRPTPGAGSVAALTAAHGAALVTMIARTTAEKRRDQDPDRARFMAEIAEEAEQYRTELLDLADRDTTAYNRVRDATRMPQTSDEEMQKRHEALQNAYKEATEVPHRTAQVCERVLELAERAVQRGIRAALSDAATAAEIAEAALHSALLVVDINLKSVEDERYRHLYHNKVVHLGRQARERKDAVLAIAEDWIRPE